MALPTISPDDSKPLLLPLELLTPSSFAPFGTVITAPIPTNIISSPSSSTPHSGPQAPSHNPLQPPHQEPIPSPIPKPRHASQATPVYANQTTALKTSPISPLLNEYPPASHTSSPPKPAARPLISMFSCYPRSWPTLLASSASTSTPTPPPSSSTTSSTLSSSASHMRFELKVHILERHPCTTQTFSPLGLSLDDTSRCFIVIVAPSLPSSSSSSSSSSLHHPPDLSNLKAFLATGSQAITYGVGTWHAPMVVLGTARIDFVVTQFVNGIAEDDCQEVLVDGVSVDLEVVGKKMRWDFVGEVGEGGGGRRGGRGIGLGLGSGDGDGVGGEDVEDGGSLIGHRRAERVARKGKL